MKMKKKIIREVCALLCSAAFWLVIILAAIPNAQKHDEKQVVKNNETQKDFVCVYLENEEVEKTEEKEEIVVLQAQQKEDKKEDLGEFVLTAYCSCEKCCGEWALNRPKDENGNDIVYGASGAVLVEGVSIAVDPCVIPYGARVYFSGKEYIAHDCGGAIKGNRIDVYFNDHLKALEFGRQKANVEVLYE
jgi:3D (Asp-Asp-Asp) domain-containing protein